MMAPVGMTSPDLLRLRAGIYSPPPTTKQRSRDILLRKFSFRTSLRSFSQEVIVTEDFLQKFLLNCTTMEIHNNIPSMLKIEYLSPKTIPWLIKWATNNAYNELGIISLATLGFLAFPDQKIPGLLDTLFRTKGLIKDLLRVAVDEKLPLAKNIELEELDIGQQIGGGAGGFVYEAMYKNQPVAVKMFKMYDFWMSPQKEFNYEATVISLFGSFKHFIHCFGVNFKQGFIVMPIAKNRSLANLINSGEISAMDWNFKIRIVRQISKAMSTLHQFGIIHRDLKPANVLLDKEYNCYLCDFGVSSSVAPVSKRARAMTMNIGTATFMAPEVSEGNGFYFGAIDVFSFGTILWQLASECTNPYIDQGIHLFQIPEFLSSGNRLEIPESCPPAVSQLISQCWHPNPKKRPSFKQITQSLKS